MASIFSPFRCSKSSRASRSRKSLIHSSGVCLNRRKNSRSNWRTLRPRISAIRFAEYFATRASSGQLIFCADNAPMYLGNSEENAKSIKNSAITVHVHACSLKADSDFDPLGFRIPNFGLRNSKTRLTTSDSTRLYRCAKACPFLKHETGVATRRGVPNANFPIRDRSLT